MINKEYSNIRSVTYFISEYVRIFIWNILKCTNLFGYSFGIFERYKFIRIFVHQLIWTCRYIQIFVRIKIWYSLITVQLPKWLSWDCQWTGKFQCRMSFVDHLLLTVKVQHNCKQKLGILHHQEGHPLSILWSICLLFGKAYLQKKLSIVLYFWVWLSHLNKWKIAQHARSQNYRLQFYQFQRIVAIVIALSPLAKHGICIDFEKERKFFRYFQKSGKLMNY